MKSIGASLFLCLFILMAAYFLPKFWAEQSLSTVVLSYAEETSSVDSALDLLIINNIKNLSALDRSNWELVEQPLRLKGQISATKLWVDQCEVSQSAYSQFINWHNSHHSEYLPPSTLENHRIAGMKNAPVAGISHQAAKKYCQHAGGRLPSQREFYALSQDASALSGNTASLYPYGNTYNLKTRPFSEPWLNAFLACDQQTADITHAKLINLSSGVSEWVVSTDSPVAMGGNGFDLLPEVSSLNLIKRRFNNNQSLNQVGFRCVYESQIHQSSWDTKIVANQVSLGKLINSQQPESQLISYLPTIEQDSLLNLTKKLPKHSPKIWVTKNEISVSQYRKFLMDPFVYLKFYANEREPVGLSYRPQNWKDQQITPDSAVRFVDWWSAYAFANWIGGRLPSEREWLRIAERYTQLPEPRMLDEGQVLLGESIKDQDEIDSDKALSISLLKGVSEWTKTAQFQGGIAKFVVKGGNFILPVETQTPAFSLYMSPEQKSSYTGFRVVFDQEY
jgi:formylglycine-generating enzyme required for sulfatase activity